MVPRGMSVEEPPIGTMTSGTVLALAAHWLMEPQVLPTLQFMNTQRQNCHALAKTSLSFMVIDPPYHKKTNLAPDQRAPSVSFLEDVLFIYYGCLVCIPEEGMRSHETTLIDSWELPCGCWECNPELLEEVNR